MKANPDMQRQLLDLADIDADIARLDHRGAHLPEDAELSELSTTLDAARDDLVRAEIAAEDLTRDYRRIEGEVNGMATREAKDSALLTGGGLAPKALNELQHEITGLGRRRAMMEDELLAVMEQQEALGAERQRAEATVVDVQTKIAEAGERRAHAVTEIEADRASKAAQRDQVAAGIDADLLALYDKQRASGRIGAGLLRARRCGACRMEIDRGTLASITARSADDVVRCEECGAILVRTHESGLGKQ